MAIVGFGEGVVCPDDCALFIVAITCKSQIVTNWSIKTPAATDKDVMLLSLRLNGLLWQFHNATMLR